MEGKGILVMKEMKKCLVTIEAYKAIEGKTNYPY
jgi:hypothetical protein